MVWLGTLDQIKKKKTEKEKNLSTSEMGRPHNFFCMHEGKNRKTLTRCFCLAWSETKLPVLALSKILVSTRRKQKVCLLVRKAFFVFFFFLSKKKGFKEKET